MGGGEGREGRGDGQRERERESEGERNNTNNAAPVDLFQTLPAVNHEQQHILALVGPNPGQKLEFGSGHHVDRRLADLNLCLGPDRLRLRI